MTEETRVTEARIREIGGKFREFGEYAQNEYLRIGVTIQTDEYYMDLGQFGEQSTSIELEDDYYELDPDTMMEQMPINSATMIELAEELQSFQMQETTKEATLDQVLTSMEQNGGGALARILRTVVKEFDGIVLKASDMTGLSIGPLPPEPLPWPGYGRPEVDYTAKDFPFRYQPPPGFDWSREPYSQTPLAPADAVCFTVGDGQKPKIDEMFLDSLGRVRWYRPNEFEDNADTFESGVRWRVWHMAASNGTPEARGFSYSTTPRALDRDGTLVLNPDEPDDDRKYPYSNYMSESTFNNAQKRLKEIQDEYERKYGNGVVTAVNDPQYDPLTVPLKEGSTYDPLTVPLKEGSTLIKSETLRLGDDIIGTSFGRVVRIENDRIVMNRAGKENTTPYNPTFVWSVKEIDVPDRDSIPTAVQMAVEPEPVF